MNDSLLKFHGQCLQESSIKPDVTTESTACADAGTRGEEESQDTASSTSPLADPSLEDAVFSAPHKTSASSSRKQGLNVSFIKDRDDLPTMQTTPDSSSVSRLQQSKQLVDSLRSSQYGGLERRLKATRSSRKLLDYSALDPSLGYDWIAGALDSEEGRGSVLDAPDEYFDMMKEFRRVNKDLCTRPTPLRQVDTHNCSTCICTYIHAYMYVCPYTPHIVRIIIIMYVDAYTLCACMYVDTYTSTVSTVCAYIRTYVSGEAKIVEYVYTYIHNLLQLFCL